ncbi:MAG: hypothetical protein P4M12_08065 [Gammaproteobacteria bacterium]|nr:hypothetical protein [Gammaproteobacteria bacterium]
MHNRIDYSEGSSFEDSAFNTELDTVELNDLEFSYTSEQALVSAVSNPVASSHSAKKMHSRFFKPSNRQIEATEQKQENKPKTAYTQPQLRGRYMPISINVEHNKNTISDQKSIKHSQKIK